MLSNVLCNFAVTAEKYKDKVAEMRRKILLHRDEWEEQKHPWGVDFWTRF